MSGSAGDRDWPNLLNTNRSPVIRNLTSTVCSVTIRFSKSASVAIAENPSTLSQRRFSPSRARRLIAGGNNSISCGMDPVDSRRLREEVEGLHFCTAYLVQCAPVRMTSGDFSVCDGVVYIFDLEGHPTTMRAYAWASPLGRDNRRHLFVV